MTEKQKKFLEEYRFERNIMLTGDVGVGKTYQAKQQLKKFEELKKQDPDNYFGLSYEITDTRFKEYLGSGALRLKRPEEWQSKITEFPLEAMIKAKVLLYDDLGTSDITEAYLRKFMFVIEERIEKKLPTIFTTNLSPQEIETRFGKRNKSRIFLNCAFLEMKGEDRRRKNILVV